MHTTTEYDYTVYRRSMVNLRTTTNYFDDDGELITFKYHRQVIDSINDDLTTLPDECFKVCMALRKAFEDDELLLIRDGLAETDIVSEGETVEGEAAEKQGWFARMATWFKAHGDV